MFKVTPPQFMTFCNYQPQENGLELKTNTCTTYTVHIVTSAYLTFCHHTNNYENCRPTYTHVELKLCGIHNAVPKWPPFVNPL